MKTKTSGPCPRVSDFLVLGLALEFAFVTSSQILLMRPHFENWSTEGLWRPVSPIYHYSTIGTVGYLRAKSLNIR